MRGGGKHNTPISSQQERPYHLQLINSGSDCFVNSVIQLLRVTDYAYFLKIKLPPLLADKPSQDFDVCKVLSRLYSGKTRGQLSAGSIRRYVAQKSGKSYLNSGTQQDAEEFFRALEETISDELMLSEEFRVLRGKHWGRQEIRRLFCDNTENGKCGTCNQYPSSKEEQFFIIPLNVPISESGVSLSSVIQNHFLESTRTDKIRCPNCCPHDKNGLQCTRTGVCRDRDSAECIQLIKTPEFLFIQLLRYDGTNQKVMTFVNIDAELELPSKEIYETVAIINHIGETTSSGHYVTHLRDDSGQWMLFDDTFSRTSSLKEANTAENYILLFKKKCTRINLDTINLPWKVDDVTTTLSDEQITKEGEISITFVDDCETNMIEDTLAEQSKSNNSCNEVFNTKSCSTPNPLPTTFNECGLEPEKNKALSLLVKECRGCLKVFERLLTHLNSKKGATCLERYTRQEIDSHKQLVIANKNANAYKKQGEKRKQQYATNKENVLEKRKQHYATNKEDVLEKKKQHYATNKEDVLEKKAKLRSAQKSRPISAIRRLRVRGRVKSVVTLRGTHKQT